MLLEECFFCVRTTWNGSCSSEHKTIPYGSQTQKTEQRTTSTQRHSSFDTYRTPNPEKGISQYLPSLIVGSHQTIMGLAVSQTEDLLSQAPQPGVHYGASNEETCTQCFTPLSCNQGLGALASHISQH